MKSTDFHEFLYLLDMEIVYVMDCPMDTNWVLKYLDKKYIGQNRNLEDFHDRVDFLL